MSLLKELIKETAAGGSTGAGAIAAVPGAIGAKEKVANKKKLKTFLYSRKLPANVREMVNQDNMIMAESVSDFISSAREFVKHGTLPIYNNKRTQKSDENNDGELRDPPDMMHYFAKMLSGLKKIVDRKDSEERTAVKDINFRTDQHGEDWIKKMGSSKMVDTISSKFRDPAVKRAINNYIDDIEDFFMGEPTFVSEAVLCEAEGVDFDPSDVISKLKSAEKKATSDDDTVRFGLEDESGNIVKVWVRADQAEDFEQALGARLTDKDTDGKRQEDDVTAIEIAEVLYELKDKFDIIDVEWPDIPEDEEEESDDVTGDEAGDDLADDTDDNLDDDAEGEDDPEAEGDDLDMEADSSTDDAESATSALQSVIDVMKADAEARKAEADAKKAEADSKSGEYAAKASEEKLKQEEEILDMETYYKNKKEGDDEAKRLAKLAKYKHDLAADGGEGLGSETTEMSSEEEEESVDGVISRDTLMNKISDFLRNANAAQ